jgi:hypothetical protein
MEKFGSNWVDFHEILYESIFLKSVYKIQGSSKSEKNDGYFALGPMHIFDHLSFIFLRMRNIREKPVENIKTHFMPHHFFENSAFREIICKNIVEPDRPRMTI